MSARSPRDLVFAAGLGIVVGCAGDDEGCDDSICVYDNPPNTVILGPEPDATFAIDEPIPFEGLVADDGPLADLDVQWFLNDEVIGESEPDADGRVLFEVSIAEAGLYRVELLAFDLSGNQGMAAVEIVVAE